MRRPRPRPSPQMRPAARVNPPPEAASAGRWAGPPSLPEGRAKTPSVPRNATWQCTGIVPESRRDGRLTTARDPYIRLDYVLISCVPSRYCTGAGRNAPCASARGRCLKRPGPGACTGTSQMPGGMPEGCPSCMDWPLGWVQPAAQKYQIPVRSRGTRSPGIF